MQEFGLSTPKSSLVILETPSEPIQPLQSLRGAIFDCDGLIADTETPDYEAWRRIYENQGLRLPVEAWAQTVGMAKGHEAHDWHGPLAKAIGQSYNPEATQNRRRSHYQEAIGKLTPMPGIVALLDAFDAENIPYAVASNSEKVWVTRILKTIGLTSRFKVIATIDDVDNPKPAPDVYLLAAERLGVPPEHCVAFEDSPRGLAAAHAAGMFTVAVPTPLTRHLDFAQAHHLVETLEHLTLEELKTRHRA